MGGGGAVGAVAGGHFRLPATRGMGADGGGDGGKSYQSGPLRLFIFVNPQHLSA